VEGCLVSHLLMQNNIPEDRILHKLILEVNHFYELIESRNINFWR
jgi:hypothetical protein